MAIATLANIPRRMAERPISVAIEESATKWIPKYCPAMVTGPAAVVRLPLSDHRALAVPVRTGAVQA